MFGMRVGVLFVGVGLFLPVAVSAQPRVEVFVVEPAITNYYVFPGEPLPPVCQKTTGIKVSACRGEYEPASFVVQTDQPLEAVRIEVEPLTGPAGALPREAVDIRTVKLYYTSVPGTGPGEPVPLLLLHDDALISLVQEPVTEEGKEPKYRNVPRDPLKDSSELQPVRIEDLKQFWITVHVPEDAVPGTYRAPIRIVPRNAPPQELTLEVQVWPFRLLPPRLEYSIYYPAYLSLPEGAGWGRLSPRQYRLELENMKAHGLDNPNIYGGPVKKPDGSLDFTPLEEILNIREQVGMRGEPLYLLGAPIAMSFQPLTDEEFQESARVVRETVAWARARGYPDVYFYAADEQWGANLLGERSSFQAIHEGGGKVFVACYMDFYELVGDLLDLPILIADLKIDFVAGQMEPHAVLRSAPEIEKAGSFTHLSTSRYRRRIDNVHHRGNPIYCYMNPMAGIPFPELHRRNEGLGLWKTGLDGTMNWSYSHIQAESLAEQPMIFGYVYRTEDGVIDTLNWEGFREAVDDVRYLTTLQAALARASGPFGEEPLIRETHEWLRQVDVEKGNLNEIRAEMAQRIEALAELGEVDLPLEKVLPGVDITKIEVIDFPEPWRFKIDPQDEGVKGRWFDPDLDDHDWAQLRTDRFEGWNTQGYGGPEAVGYGWYRADLPGTPEQWAQPHLYLFFNAVDEGAYVYLNGQLVFERTVASTGQPGSELWNTPFSAPLKNVRREGPNQLTVRVHNESAMGGIYRPVHLIASPVPLQPRQIENLVRERRKPQ